jgi:hypothetical protein
MPAADSIHDLHNFHIGIPESESVTSLFNDSGEVSNLTNIQQYVIDQLDKEYKDWLVLYNRISSRENYISFLLRRIYAFISHRDEFYNFINGLDTIMGNPVNLPKEIKFMSLTAKLNDDMNGYGIYRDDELVGFCNHGDNHSFGMAVYEMWLLKEWEGYDE